MKVFRWIDPRWWLFKAKRWIYIRGIKNDPDLKQAIRQAFDRDQRHCLFCGYKGKNLEIHHIYHAPDFPDRACDPNNIISLCNKCHNNFHAVYGYDASSPEYVREWLEKRSSSLPIAYQIAHELKLEGEAHGD